SKYQNWLYQYALSLKGEKSCLSNETYFIIPSNSLKIPSGANNEGALVVGSSPQQLSSNFITSSTTWSIWLFIRNSIACLDSSLSSINKIGLRFNATSIDLALFKLISLAILCRF